MASALSDYHPEKYEMFLCEETMAIFHGKSPSWLAADDGPWTTYGIDPSIFPQGQLPMKRVALDTAHHHSVALLAFAMAHRANHVIGPPRYLLTFRLSPEDVFDHSWEGSLKVYPETHTLAIMKTLDLTNFPGLRDCLLHPIAEEVGKQYLQIGYSYIGA